MAEPKAAPTHAAPARRARRPWILLLLAGSAVLYLWNLTASGWANSYYAAATQAAAQSWKAFLFGSVDAGNVITVDKPPASLWLSGLFARVFGVSSWSVLAPQALCGVASVGLLYLAVKRTSGRLAGLLAGAALALTPVATLMFRFNLPDPLLVLLLIAAAYATIRAVEKASLRWLLLAGTAIGFAFLTKMMQGFLTLPALTLVYLVAAPTTLWKRIAHVLAAGAAVVVSAGWYVALVALWPADSRPYIAGSTDNSILELALGYNGLGRIFGGEGNPGGGGGGGMGGGNTGFGGASGIGRMFGAAFGTEISWLLPTALVGLVAGLWFTRRAPRTDRTRAALLLWGGWLVVTALVFSFMSGIIHPYYSVALAPGIAGVVAISARELWRGRAHPPARYFLAGMVAVTGVWTFILLDRWSDWQPWLRWVIVIASVAVATAIAVGMKARVLAVAGIVTALLGTGMFSVATAAVAHSGSIPTSGPTSEGFGGMGGALGGGSTSAELVSLLRSTDTEWAAATTGATSAADLELASGKSVIGIGGFSGGDPAPTLAAFKQYVADGKVAYYVSGGGMGGGGGPGGNSDIAQWVADNYQSTTVGNATVYDLRS
jgi:4-amino-4-deoxy-L-arabinose transferase-like glycosyltransferase